MTVLKIDRGTIERPQPVVTGWQHLPALDGMRAVAVAAVLAFHAGYLQGGFLGVDLFFALSGFLITSLLVRDASHVELSTRRQLATFWGRRFRRLLPAVFTLIAVTALWTWGFGSGAELASVKRDGPWAVLYVANWHFIAEAQGYWASFAQPGMFDHLWSLAIEEQFYVLWPIVVFGVWRVSRSPQRTLATVAIAGAVLSVITMVLLSDGGDPTRVYMGTDTRAASLLVGAVAATDVVRIRIRTLVARLGRRVDVVLGLLVAGIAWSWVAVDGASSSALYRGGLFAHSIACAALVVIGATTAESRVVRVFSIMPLVRIGVLSYGLYLWHWPVYVTLSPERTNLDGVALLVLRVGVSLLLAIASYRLVEDPVRHRARWARGRRGVAVLATAVVALLVVLVAIPEPRAEIAAFDASTVEAAVPLAPTAVSTTVAPTTTTTTDAPRPTATAAVDDLVRNESATPRVVGAPATTTTVATRLAVDSIVWAGDSVAFDLAPAIHAALGAAGVEADVASAYPGYRIVTDDDGISIADRAVAAATELGAQLVVVELSAWDSTVDDDTYAAALLDFSQRLELIGAHLVMVPPPPTGSAESNREFARLATVAARLATGDSIVMLDPSSVWGVGGDLDLDDDGAPERKRDLLHVCPSGAARFAAWLANELAQRYDAIVPAPATAWAASGWTHDARYDDPPGACAPV